MAEAQFKLDFNGQAVQQEDFDLIGETSGLADDRVLAELFRMQPYDGSTVRKGVLRYGYAAAPTDELVAPNGASGSVKVRAFRAFVGTRTAVASDSKENWRDIRSALYMPTGALSASVSIAANAAGNPRWDLVYAAVAVDADSTTDTRKVKDPTSLVVTEETVSTSTISTVTVGVQAGTAAASPVFPSTPSDSGGTYYIPLAYVRVPNGFGGASQVLNGDIADGAPHLLVSQETGGQSVAPGSAMRSLTSAQQQSWGSTGTRPNTFMPGAMTGGATRFFAINTSTMSSGDVLDSGDWRDRSARFTLVAEDISGTSLFGWADGFDSPLLAENSDPITRFGQTYLASGGGFVPASGCMVAYAGGGDFANCTNFTDPDARIGIYCDLADSGKLKFYKRGTFGGNVKALAWIEFTAPFHNV